VSKYQQSWTTGEVKVLRECAHLGADELARRLGRTRPSVKRAAQRYRISLRRPGVRDGLLLGQPRGLSLRRDMREALLAYPHLLEQRLQMDYEAELCPACAAREISVASTGLCRPCHLRHLAEIHREAIAEQQAKRALWVERQRLHRAREAEPGE